MDVFNAYTYGTAAWLSVQALPLLITPKVIIAMLSSDVHRATDLELYFSRSLGFSLFALGLIVLFFTGAIPLSITEPDDLGDAPYAIPIVRVMTLSQTTSLIYCYVRYMNSGQVGYVLGATGYGFMAAMGLWIVIFGTTASHVSKRTGADKRTTGFPFKNQAAYNKKADRKMI